MATDADVKTVREWLHLLHGHVRQMRLDHYIFEETQKLVAANPALHKPSHFFTWMQDMYVAAMASAIRRQMDDDPRTISTLRFLKRVEKQPDLVSRARGTRRSTRTILVMFASSRGSAF